MWNHVCTVQRVLKKHSYKLASQRRIHSCCCWLCGWSTHRLNLIGLWQKSSSHSSLQKVRGQREVKDQAESRLVTDRQEWGTKNYICNFISVILWYQCVSLGLISLYCLNWLQVFSSVTTECLWRLSISSSSCSKKELNKCNGDVNCETGVCILFCLNLSHDVIQVSTLKVCFYNSETSVHTALKQL